MSGHLKERQVVLTAAIYLILDPYVKDPVCKIPMKKICRSAKKALKIYKNQDGIEHKYYADLGKLAYDTKIAAYEKMVLEDSANGPINKINPYVLITTFQKKHPDLMEMLEIDDRTMDQLKSIYKNTGLLLPSIMYVNRIVNTLKEKVNEFKEKECDMPISATRAETKKQLLN